MFNNYKRMNDKNERNEVKEGLEKEPPKQEDKKEKEQEDENNNEEINKTIETMMTKYGIPLDTTYTGKAFCGMQKYLREHEITGKRVLFIHTGGTPLFFEYLREK